MKKRVIVTVSVLAVVLAIVIAVIVVVNVRNNRPPEFETIRARVTSLLTDAQELNEILWGKGLPTYPRATKELATYTVTRGEGEEKKNHTIYYYIFTDGEGGTMIAYQYWVRESSGAEGGGWVYTDVEKEETLAAKPATYRYARAAKEEKKGYIYHSEESGNYYYPEPDFTEADEPFFYDASADPNYDYVRYDCGYLLVEDIQRDARAVYSAAVYRAIDEAVFTGIKAFDRDDGVSFPRYRNQEGANGEYSLVKINKTWDHFKVERLVFDFDTLEMVKPSKRRSVTVAVDCYPEGAPEKKENRTFRFVLEDGEWYLDDYAL